MIRIIIFIKFYFYKNLFLTLKLMKPVRASTVLNKNIFSIKFRFTNNNL